MIVNQLDLANVISLKPEDDPVPGRNVDRPESPEVALQRMRSRLRVAPQGGQPADSGQHGENPLDSV